MSRLLINAWKIPILHIIIYFILYMYIYLINSLRIIIYGIHNSVEKVHTNVIKSEINQLLGGYNIYICILCFDNFILFKRVT